MTERQGVPVNGGRRGSYESKGVSKETSCFVIPVIRERRMVDTNRREWRMVFIYRNLRRGRQGFGVGECLSGLLSWVDQISGSQRPVTRLPKCKYYDEKKKG